MHRSAIVIKIFTDHVLRRAAALLFAHEGARHLYCLDYVDTNLPDLKSTIEKAYPDVKVTTIQADAADEKATIAVCERAIVEEGKLDVFFANVSGFTQTLRRTNQLMEHRLA